MKWRVGSALGVLACVATAACGGAPRAGGAAAANDPVGTVTVTDELRANGRTSYRKYCAQCHGYNGRGDGPSAASLTPPPRDHTDAEVMNAITDRTIAETVRFGGESRGFPGMPSFPNLSTDELVSLVAYVRSLSHPGVRQIDLEGFR